MTFEKITPAEMQRFLDGKRRLRAGAVPLCWYVCADGDKFPVFFGYKGRFLDMKMESLADLYGSQKALADLAGVQPSDINRVVRGVRPLTYELAMKIARGIADSAK